MSNGSSYAPRFEVRIAGLTLGADVTDQTLSVTYDNNLDLADMFRLVLLNADNRFLDSALFDLGKTVEIHMGYGHDLRPMMLGEITSLEPSFPNSGPPTLTISGYDRSYRLRHNEPDRPPFRFVSDSLIAAQIAVEAGLIPVVDPSPIFHLCPVPQTGSDMAFLKDRARANFFDVYVHWDKLYFQFPRPQTDAYVLEWGKNLSSFSPRLSSSGLTGLQVIRSYNEELAQTIVAFATAADLDLENIIEKLGSAALDLLLSLGRRAIRNQPVKSPLDAAVLAKSILQDILEGLYEGTGSCIGTPDLRAGRSITIRGVGKRFSGGYRLRKVTHTIDDGGYQTTFEVTQRSGGSLLQLLRKTTQESPPPNERERFYGVAVAQVTQNSEATSVPPAAPLGRVKVKYPWLSDKYESCWARCATPMAGKEMGLYFPPEVGDEVLVAFEHGDLCSPVVLGSLWNGSGMPPETNDGLNRLRLIKSRSGHTITFDDTREVEQVVIKSHSGHTITLDDTKGREKVVITSRAEHTITLDDTKDSEKVVIKDKGGSVLTMNVDGSVTLSARKDLTLSADKEDGTITLEAANVKVKVKNTMDVNGLT